MQIASSKTREKFPLSQKKIIKKTLLTVIAYFFIMVFGIGFLFLSGGMNVFIFILLILGFFIIPILAYSYQSWYFAVYFYDLTQDFIQIKKGPITPREITIPYERIQDVYVDQDLFDRIFGLYDVHLSSATYSSGMAAHIDGVEKDAAEGLKEILLRTVKERISKKDLNPIN
jgi:membrane protein YdbS with pleckstrin-like domain